MRRYLYESLGDSFAIFVMSIVVAVMGSLRGSAILWLLPTAWAIVEALRIGICLRLDRGEKTPQVAGSEPLPRAESSAVAVRGYRDLDSPAAPHPPHRRWYHGIARKLRCKLGRHRYTRLVQVGASVDCEAQYEGIRDGFWCLCLRCEERCTCGELSPRAVARRWPRSSDRLLDAIVARRTHGV